MDNKRYYTWNTYLKQNFDSKVYKVPLNAGFTCPNRDGSKSLGGCIFCSSLGSGEFAGSIQDDLLTQYKQGCEMMERKWPHSKTIPYFQSFTNTYGPLSKIKSMVEPFLDKEEVVALAIATRADCLSDECIAYLNDCTSKKEIWIELGLQSIFDKTSELINRAHTYQDFLNCINKLKETKIKICVHLMNGLPNESKEMMIKSAKEVGGLPIHALKIHMLHIIKGTAMEQYYYAKPFDLLTLEEYVDVVVKQLEVLRPEIILQRLTGDGIKEDLVAPIWTLNKTIVLNEIDKLMVKKDTMQGVHYEQR